MKNIIGIDLGDSQSCMAVFGNEKLLVIPNESGEYTIPSMVGISADERFVSGYEAQSLLVNNSNRVASSVLDVIENNKKMKIDGEEFISQQIAAVYLHDLTVNAELRLKETLSRAVIAVPHYLHFPSYIQSIQESAKIAGIEVTRFISSLSAVAVYYAYRHEEEEDEETILIINIGENHMEGAIVEFESGVVEVKSIASRKIGCDNIDEKMVSWVAQEYEKSKKEVFLYGEHTHSIWKKILQKTKMEMTLHESVILSVPVGSEYFRKTLTKENFNSFTQELEKMLQDMVHKAISDAGVEAKAISKVLLCGKSGELLCAKNTLNSILGTPIIDFMSEDVVAKGAALIGGVMSGEVKNILLLDVCPFSIEVKTLDGRYRTIVEIGTTIPTIKSETFEILREKNQKAITITINLKQNDKSKEYLYTFTTEQLAEDERGFQVSVDIDARGQLALSLYQIVDVETKPMTCISSTLDELSEKELIKLHKELRHLQKNN